MSKKRFPDNARVVFIGDSITAMGRWISYIQQYYAEHLPKSNVKCFNAGIGATTIPIGREVLDANLMVWNPTHVVVMWCGNDLGLGESGSVEQLREKSERYYTNLTNIVLDLKERGLEVMLMTPTPDGIVRDNVPETLGDIEGARVIMRVAKEQDLEVYDIYPKLVSAKRIVKLTDADNVHNTNLGCSVVARMFLREQGFDAYTEIPNGPLMPLDHEPYLHPLLVERWEIENLITAIWACETNMLWSFRNAPLQEKLDYLRERIPNGNDGAWDGWYRNIAEIYSDDREHLESLVARVNVLTEQFIQDAAARVIPDKRV